MLYSKRHYNLIHNRFITFYLLFMLEEENDPEAELQKFSEKTNYLKEWVMGKKKKKNSQYVDRENIPEDVDQNTPRKSTQSKEMR